MSRYNTVEMKLDQILVSFLNYYHLKCLSVANLFNQPNKIKIKMAQHISWRNQTTACVTGTKQWHRTAKLAATEQWVYCIVNELNRFRGAGHRGGSLSCCWPWLCRCVRGTSWWAGGPRPPTFATPGTGGLTAGGCGQVQALHQHLARFARWAPGPRKRQRGGSGWGLTRSLAPACSLPLG